MRSLHATLGSSGFYSRLLWCTHSTAERAGRTSPAAQRWPRATSLPVWAAPPLFASSWSLQRSTTGIEIKIGWLKIFRCELNHGQNWVSGEKSFLWQKHGIWLDKDILSLSPDIPLLFYQNGFENCKRPYLLVLEKNIPVKENFTSLAELSVYINRDQETRHCTPKLTLPNQDVLMKHETKLSPQAQLSYTEGRDVLRSFLRINTEIATQPVALKKQWQNIPRVVITRVSAGVEYVWLKTSWGTTQIQCFTATTVRQSSDLQTCQVNILWTKQTSRYQQNSSNFSKYQNDSNQSFFFVPTNVFCCNLLNLKSCHMPHPKTLFCVWFVCLFVCSNLHLAHLHALTSINCRVLQAPWRR